ncbi:MAG: transporter substrate-binding domain-containing protein [Candidatus Babeliaceae bacterium]
MKKGMNKQFTTLLLIVITSILVFWLHRIQRKKTPVLPETIVIGTSADFKPISFRQDDQLVGFDIDVVTEVAKRINKPFVIKDMPFDLLIPQLQLGSIQIVAAGITATPERTKRAIFTTPYINSNPLFVLTKADTTPLKSIEDLKGKTVIVNQGYTADLYMSLVTDINLVRLPSLSDALLALMSGRGDALVTAGNTLNPLFEHYPKEKFNLFMIPETNDTVSLAISSHYPELARQVQHVLQTMEQDGTLITLKEKWKLT